MLNNNGDKWLLAVSIVDFVHDYSDRKVDMKNSTLTTGLVYYPTAKDWKMDGTPIEIVLENPSKPATEKPELPGYEELKGLMTGATIESSAASSPFTLKEGAYKIEGPTEQPGKDGEPSVWTAEISIADYTGDYTKDKVVPDKSVLTATLKYDQGDGEWTLTSEPLKIYVEYSSQEPGDDHNKPGTPGSDQNQPGKPGSTQTKPGTTGVSQNKPSAVPGSSKTPAGTVKNPVSTPAATGAAKSEASKTTGTNTADQTGITAASLTAILAAAAAGFMSLLHFRKKYED